MCRTMPKRKGIDKRVESVSKMAGNGMAGGFFDENNPKKTKETQKNHKKTWYRIEGKGDIIWEFQRKKNDLLTIYSRIVMENRQSISLKLPAREIKKV